MKRLLLVLLLTAPAFGETVFVCPDWIDSRSFATQDAAINFIVSIPFDERNSARLVSLGSPAGDFHVIWRPLNEPKLGSWSGAGEPPPRAYASLVLDPEYGRKACAAEWDAGHSCWYEVTAIGESVVLTFSGWPVAQKSRSVRGNRTP
jgi:hypothetical protein